MFIFDYNHIGLQPFCGKKECTIARTQSSTRFLIIPFSPSFIIFFSIILTCSRAVCSRIVPFHIILSKPFYLIKPRRRPAHVSALAPPSRTPERIARTGQRSASRRTKFTLDVSFCVLRQFSLLCSRFWCSSSCVFASEHKN